MYLIIRKWGENKDYYDTYTYKTPVQFNKYWFHHKHFCQLGELYGYEEQDNGDLKLIKRF